MSACHNARHPPNISLPEIAERIHSPQCQHDRFYRPQCVTFVRGSRMASRLEHAIHWRRKSPESLEVLPLGRHGPERKRGSARREDVFLFPGICVHILVGLNVHHINPANSVLDIRSGRSHSLRHLTRWTPVEANTPTAAN